MNPKWSQWTTSGSTFTYLKMRALSKRFQCSVSLYPREGDSKWSDLDLSKPADEPRILRAFTTPEAASEHGIALGHILTTIY